MGDILPGHTGGAAQVADQIVLQDLSLYVFLAFFVVYAMDAITVPLGTAISEGDPKMPHRAKIIRRGKLLVQKQFLLTRICQSSCSNENTRPRKLVADLSLDEEAFQSVIRKNGWNS